MKNGRIRQTVTFQGVRPLQVYDLIMNAKKHSAFIGSKVIMSAKLNGKFQVFNGYCTGFNIELNAGKKIIQGWHFKEEGWPDDHFSICTFLFEKVPAGTTLTFTQSGIPAHKVDSLKAGWKEFYWEPMKKYLFR